jgi:hypothetical protein
LCKAGSAGMKNLFIRIKCRIFPFIWSAWLCQELNRYKYKFLIKSNSPTGEGYMREIED